MNKYKFNRMSRDIRIASMLAIGIFHMEGDGGVAGEVKMSKADFDKAIADATKTAVDAETAGLKTKNSALIAEQKKYDALQAQLKLLGDDPDALKNILQFKTKIEQDEILKLASEGKHSEAIEKALEKTKVTFSAEKLALEGKLSEAEKRANELDLKFSALLVDGEITKSFLEEKGNKDAIEAAVLLGKKVFRVESGEVVARNEKGEMIQGERGPLTIKEYIVSMKKIYPSLFPKSAGGLGDGSSGEGNTGNVGDAEMIAAASRSVSELRALKVAKAAKLKGK